MRQITRLMGLGWLLLALVLVAACTRTPEGEPPLVPVTSAPTDTPTTATAAVALQSVAQGEAVQPTATATPTEEATPTPTTEPITESDLEQALDVVRDFLASLARGEYRTAYGSLLTTQGQQRLAELVLGRLALPNPHISFFEVLGAEPILDRIAVDVTWQETFDGQGLVGTQEARVYLARQEAAFLVDDVDLDEYQPAATPVPPPLPRAEALTNPAVPGQEMNFRASGFESAETVLVWLELPDGTLSSPGFYTADGDGVFEATYAGEATSDLGAGRWIWWAQALRDSTRNTGITFEVLSPPSPTPTAPPTPTARPQPTATPRPPTPTPEPSVAYGAPQALWPELETSRDFGSALVVEFVPVTEQLAADEFYELVLEARDLVGNIYNAGSVRGKGDACSGQYAQACLSLTADERFMALFHPEGVEGKGTWWVQVVKETAPGQFTAVSPPSEPRIVLLKPRS